MNIMTTALFRTYREIIVYEIVLRGFPYFKLDKEIKWKNEYRPSH